MSFENPMTFVRSIKGAPASVLLALLFTRHPMTNQELQRWTGYSEESVTQAVRILLDLGWVSAVGPRGPWTMNTERQLPLGAGDIPEIPGSIPSSSSIVDSNTLPMQEEDEKEGDAEPETIEDENFVKTLHALYDAGIREPTAGRLARLPHVTPEYVAAHVEQANAQGFRLGTAIYRIEHGWPIPEEKSVLSVDERIKRFLADK